MLDEEIEIPFRVSDLKQSVYCPRILYYARCQPDVRLTTYKMEAGVEPGRAEVAREERLQLAAYGLLLEEARGLPARRGFLYYLPLKRAEEVRLEARLRDKLLETLAEMRGMLEKEKMPPPVGQLRKCVACEFRRFCNDVI
ncbi:MAG: CRISPR-associated protein Cas4 [Chloroflexi bacterium]|nr:CRISPR-associated protein Cas4 [Chloroflexota bacterium]